jgi:hypothetical protein
MPVDTALTHAASEFEAQIDELAGVITVRMQEEIEELGELEAPELWEVVRRVSVGGRRALATSFRDGESLPDALPEPDVEAVHAAAAAGMSLPAVLHSFRIGHVVTMEAWLDAVERMDLPEAERLPLSRRVARFVTAYDNRLANLLGEEYERERVRAQLSPDKQRLRQIRRLIEGWSDEAEGLDYDLGFEHIGVVAWGSDARATLDDLANLLGRKLLWAPAEDELLMAWLGAPVSDGEERSRLHRFQPRGSTRITVGNAAAGLEGFRRTHREAGEAQVVATRRPRPVTLYEEVALEALALRNEVVAREFAESVLGHLNQADERGQLRQTLRAYFASSQNGASAAAALGVHEQTVSRRLSAIERLIGSPVNQRRAELELALRLEEVLTP